MREAPSNERHFDVDVGRVEQRIVLDPNDRGSRILLGVQAKRVAEVVDAQRRAFAGCETLEEPGPNFHTIRCLGWNIDDVAVIAPVVDGAGATATAVYGAHAEHSPAPDAFPPAKLSGLSQRDCGSMMRFLAIPATAAWAGTFNDGKGTHEIAACAWQSSEYPEQSMRRAVEAVFGEQRVRAYHAKKDGFDRYVVDGDLGGVFWRISVDGSRNNSNADVLIERWDPFGKDPLPERALVEDYVGELRASTRPCARQLVPTLPAPDSGAVPHWIEAASLCLDTTTRGLSPYRIATPAPFMPNLPQ
jgi:hypothetical protein